MHPVRRGFRAAARAHDALTQLCFLLGAAALAVITASYLVEVLFRYFFSAPTRWAADLVGYALLASIFLLLPHVTATRQHVSVTLLPNALSGLPLRALQMLVDLLGASACGLAAWISYGENLRQVSRGVMTLANAPIPKWTVSSFITLGLTLAALHFLRSFLRGLRGVDG